MVKINYTLKDTDGVLIDSSVGQEPFEYLHGNGNIIPGLEAALEGKAAGSRFTVTVAPKDAYGEYDEQLLVHVPREQFDSDAPIEAGMKFQAATRGGPMIVTIKEVGSDIVTVDGNHELAGKTLLFDGEIVAVRDATAEELTPRIYRCGGASCDSCAGCGTSCVLCKD